MDASNYVNSSDASNTSDVLNAILEALKIDKPNLRNLTIKNPGNDYFCVNEKKKAALKKLWDQYIEPELCKTDCYTLHQTYVNFLHGLHKQKLAASNRDQIIREEFAVNAPSSGDIIAPNVTSSVIESGKKLFGVNPENSLLLESPLRYDHEINFVGDFEACCLVKSALSKTLDIHKTLQNLIEKGSEYGLDKKQLRELMVGFCAAHLPAFHPLVQNEPNASSVFNVLCDLVNGSDDAERIRNQIATVSRAPGTPLAEVMMLLRGLHCELYNIENPFEDSSDREKRAENTVKRYLPRYLSEAAARELRKLKQTFDSRNEVFTLSKGIQFAQQLEQSEEFRLRSQKAFPREVMNLVAMQNSYKDNESGAYGNKIGKYPDRSERYEGEASRRSYRGIENRGFRSPSSDRGRGFSPGGGNRTRSPSPWSRSRERSGGERRSQWSSRSRSQESRERPRYEKNWRENRRGDSSGRRNEGQRSGRERTQPSRDRGSKPFRTRSSSRDSRPRSSSRGRACYKCGAQSDGHTQDTCPIYPGERVSKPCPNDGLYHLQSECRYAPRAKSPAGRKN